MAKQVICDNCNKIFYLNIKNLKSEIIKDDIKNIYFECPKCKYHFHSYYENQKVENLISKNQTKAKKIKKTTDKAKIKQLKKEIKAIQNIIKNEQNKIEKELRGD